MKSLFLIVSALLLTTTAFAHGISSADTQAMLEGGYLRYIWLGASHMLTGYDHLLFLFGVIFFLTSFNDIVKFVTLFTIGHSITLIFATFMKITANYWLIDAVIALSVMYKAFDNNKGFQNYLGMKAPPLLWMVLIFGLIHGFGLSTRLQKLPLGEQNSEMLMRILSFNLGVEIGQILALAVMLIGLNIWRRKKSFQRLSTVANHALMVLGFMLLLMQLHGYLHIKNQEEYGFNKDEHAHIHKDMEAIKPLPPIQHDNL